ncbi:SLC13 family permease [Aliidiomarina minuta]|uniref:SLC13 family permease n=1 Tax=Aliidiomarina minuta TaxID=880057 RepID=A0A432W109_9GAMM|nr:SLC13 family permease [Aliidiomarina minuta]RUO22910.1 SLC13 family permease [Aliidiomarina minuta]
MQLAGVLLLLAGLVAGLIFSQRSPAIFFAGALLTGYVLGWIPLDKALHNFTNSSLVTLVLLILCAIAIEKSRLTSWLSRQFSSASLTVVITRLTLTSAVLSAFINNTAVVSTLMSSLRQHPHFAASKLLLPLSYSAIMGGMLTLIGTSTNLIVNSFIEEAGLPGFSFFDFTLLGLTAFAIGFFVLLLGARWLPDNSSRQPKESSYYVTAQVPEGSPLIGHSVENNGLRHLKSLYLADIQRAQKNLCPVSPDIQLRAGDCLHFVGNLTAIPQLQEIPGLEFTPQQQQHEFELMEAVISNSSSTPLSLSRSVAVVIAFLGVLLLSLLNIVPLVKGLTVLLVLYLLTRTIKLSDIRERFPLELFIIVGSAIGLAQLMMDSGVAGLMASGLSAVVGENSPWLALAAVFLATWLFTEVITNNAAAALIFPVAYSLALQLGVDPTPFFMAVAFGASASFISPFGYQTNLMVYSAGNYKFRDYLRLGGPLCLVYSSTVLLLLPRFFPF